MVYIEFFDCIPLENICSCLSAMPEKVIMIVNDKKRMGKHQVRYQRILEGRGIETEFILFNAAKNNIQHQIEVLSSIVEKYNDCVFDLTGGEELSLVAAGIVYERYHDKKNLRLQRVNIRNNTVMDCEIDGVSEESPMPELTLEENILLYGGDIVYASETDGIGTSVWEDSEEFFRDVDKIWEIARKNPFSWAQQIGDLAFAERHRDVYESTALTTVFKPQAQSNTSFSIDDDIMDGLKKEGLIGYINEHNVFCISYKNEQVKKILNKEGLAMEMKIYVTAKRMYEDGNPMFHDVRNGVVIDWDGQIAKEGNTINEIDVCLMKGCMPVFISCKSGKVDVSELFKLNAVGEHFGGAYAKKVLMTNALPTEKGADHFIINRASDMGIRLIRNVHTFDDDEQIMDKLQKIFP